MMAPNTENTILVHVEYIRERIDELAERAKEDRQVVHDHLAEDARQFARVWNRLNRIAGGVALLVFLTGVGTAVARLVLD